MSTSERYQVKDPSLQLVDELIMRHIDRRSRVIDLGCGDGRLMERLKEEKGCHVLGVDVELSNVTSVLESRTACGGNRPESGVDGCSFRFVRLRCSESNFAAGSES